MRKLVLGIACVLTAFFISSCSSSDSSYRNLQIPAGAYITDNNSNGLLTGQLWFFQTVGIANPVALPSNLAKWQPYFMAFDSNSAYVTDISARTIWQYTVNESTGALVYLQNAIESGATLNGTPTYITFNNNLAYVLTSESAYIMSPNGESGSLNPYQTISLPTPSSANLTWYSNSISFSESYAYLTGGFYNSTTQTLTPIIAIYSISADGSLTYLEPIGQTSLPIGLTYISSVSVNNGYAYVAWSNISSLFNALQPTNGGGFISVYPLESDGTLGSQPIQTISNPVESSKSLWMPINLTFNNNSAYVTSAITLSFNFGGAFVVPLTTQSGDVSVFGVNSNGELSYSGSAVPPYGTTSYWAPIQVAFYQPNESNGGVLSYSIESPLFVINTESPMLSHTSESVTFTNTGTGNVYNINIQPSFPFTLGESSNCTAVLQPGESCVATLLITTNNNFAKASAQIGTESYTIGYSNGEYQTLNVPLAYNVESWRGTLFITNESTSGAITYSGFSQGIYAADGYCKNDVNNPHNGYTYKAVIANNQNRGPNTTSWTLYANESYFSIMSGVYNQLVLTTTDDPVIFPTNPDNCISTNCKAAMPTSDHDPYTWTGLDLNMSTTKNTCGGWLNGTGTSTGTTSHLKKNASGVIVVESELMVDCNESRAIMCAAQ